MLTIKDMVFFGIRSLPATMLVVDQGVLSLESEVYDPRNPILPVNGRVVSGEEIVWYVQNEIAREVCEEVIVVDFLETLVAGYNETDTYWESEDDDPHLGMEDRMPWDGGGW